MATVIRLARYGAKKHPYYHIVVTDSRAARNSGTILERIGSYDPMAAKDSGKRVTLNGERAKYWLGVGAKASDRVYKFMADAGILEKKALPVQTKKNQPSEKTLKKTADKAAKLAKEAEAAAAAAAPAPEPVVEVPAAEVAEAPAPEQPVEQPTAEPVAEVAEPATEAPVEQSAE